MKVTRGPMSPDERARTAHTLRWLGAGVVVLWWLCLKSYASRWFVLLNYSSTSVVSPLLEPLAMVSLATFWLSLFCAIAGIIMNELLWRRSRAQQAVDTGPWAGAVAWLALSITPWIIALLVHINQTEALGPTSGVWGPSIWQLLWLAAFTGLAAERVWRAMNAGPVSGQSLPSRARTKSKILLPGSHSNSGLALSAASWSVLVSVAAVMFGAWCFQQSRHAYQGFMLGFNDCGHFAQRIANTAAGRGWLLESPVLPPFWDHFNPGLVLLVPLWWLWPSMSMIFIVQSAALAGCAPLVFQLARTLGSSSRAAAMWALAWLMHPVLGQINLAYTYGWHPITLAMPCLLTALLCMLRRRWMWAICWAVLASSFEEGVLVIIATTSATFAVIEVFALWSAPEMNVTSAPTTHFLRVDSAVHAARKVSGVLSARNHLMTAALSSVAFIIVFRFSGLAEFQTGRFHVLGSSAIEILSSPIARPQTFWSLLLRERNAIFLAGLLIPCFLPALVRGWPLLLATVLPLGVLLVWDHSPAQSLAFHYPSTLLPVFWLAAIAGATGVKARALTPLVSPTASPAQEAPTAHLMSPNAKASNAENSKAQIEQTAAADVDSSAAMALGALVTSLIASFCLGQLPWSASTLDDAAAFTFGTQTELRRANGSEDNRFAHQQLAVVRGRTKSVLATGRFATHLVGAHELETVGQFYDRRAALAQLTPGDHPLRRYDVLILDRLEKFQQRTAQTADLEAEALANGFHPIADRFDIVVLEKR